jgi:hypothetical protein
MKKNKYPTNWAEIRVIVLERDNHTCQHCNCKQGELRTSATNKVYKSVLQVAHLDHDPENWDVSYDRLITLCQLCHLKNDREHSQQAMRQTLSEKRVSNKIAESITKPQSKNLIKELQSKVLKYEEMIIARDLKIKELLLRIGNSASEFQEVIDKEKVEREFRNIEYILSQRALRRKAKK